MRLVVLLLLVLLLAVTPVTSQVLYDPSRHFPREWFSTSGRTRRATARCTHHEDSAVDRHACLLARRVTISDD